MTLTKKMVLQTDASIKRLGTCLLQHGKPVYFASKALTETQKGYIAIELESLAVVWAMEKFHHFLCGTHFILEMDQKPLEAILSKSLNQATPQLQKIHHPDIPIPFYSLPYSRTNESTSRLLIKTREPKRQYQVAKTIHVPDFQPTQGQE